MKGQQFLLLYVFYASASTVLLYILLAGAGAEAIEVRPGGARGARLRHSSLQGGGSRGGGRPRHCVQVRHTRSCRRHRAFGARRHRRFHRYCRRRDCRRRLCHWGRRRLHRWGCLRRRWGRRWGRRRRRRQRCGARPPARGTAGVVQERLAAVDVRRLLGSAARVLVVLHAVRITAAKTQRHHLVLPRGGVVAAQRLGLPLLAVLEVGRQAKGPPAGAHVELLHLRVPGVGRFSCHRRGHRRGRRGQLHAVVRARAHPRPESVVIQMLVPLAIAHVALL
mmetsp:Transcript_20053/g.31590  ORF Transcript_20053/g.31590 Transcript_20053/m.31590 type:complete len:279 (+) Transcript_20053:263-1099(+)